MQHVTFQVLYCYHLYHTRIVSDMTRMDQVFEDVKETMNFLSVESEDTGTNKRTFNVTLTPQILVCPPTPTPGNA